MFINVNFGIIALLTLPITALVPRKLPNGRIKKYIPNKNNPKNDIQLITSKQATLVTRNWLENILNSININELLNTNNVRESEDKHIITRINELEQYIQNHNNKNNSKDIYLAWMPKCNSGNKDVLFIIVAEFIVKENIFYIYQLIQSPFWSPEQIESNELKISLNDFTTSNGFNIKLDKLYSHDLRYKLAWSIWDLTNDK